jgi:hypothetical protein
MVTTRRIVKAGPIRYWPIRACIMSNPTAAIQLRENCSDRGILLHSLLLSFILFGFVLFCYLLFNSVILFSCPMLIFSDLFCCSLLLYSRFVLFRHINLSYPLLSYFNTSNFIPVCFFRFSFIPGLLVCYVIFQITILFCVSIQVYYILHPMF